MTVDELTSALSRYPGEARVFFVIDDEEESNKEGKEDVETKPWFDAIRIKSLNSRIGIKGGIIIIGASPIVVCRKRCGLMI